MPHPLRFGVLTLQNLPFAVLLERWRIIESLNFDSAWLVDHFAYPFSDDAIWYDSWTLLAALSASTTRLRLGTLVSSITLHTPAMLAKRAMTVDHISGGRLELGIGAGRAPSDHAMTGTPYWRPAERSRRFAEFAHIVDRMLREPETTQRGKHYTVEGARMTPPLQLPRPPLTLAAHGHTTLRVVARLAESWSSFGAFDCTSTEAEQITRERGQRLDEHCHEIGRDPASIRRSFLIGFTPDTPFASSAAFEDFVERYHALGISEFIFYWLPDDGHPMYTGRGARGEAVMSRDALERLATETIPRLRARARS